MLFYSLFVPLAYLVAVVSAYADPLSCSGTCTNTHDPALIRRTADGKYFRFATGGDIPIYTSPALQGPWSYAGVVLSGGSKIDNAGSDDMWAPDITLVGSTYYLYYAVSSFGTQTSVIGLATSSDMEVGSWTDHGSIGVSSDSSKPYNAIDPNLLIDASGTYRLNFGSFWGDIYQTTLSTLTKNGGSAIQLSYLPTGTHAREGAYMIYRSGIYYLFFSEGVCCGYDTSRPAAGDEYKIKVCASSSPNSGFVDKSGVSCLSGGGTIVLESHGIVYGPGGQGVYNDPTDGWVLYYHYVDTTVGYADGDKKLGINKLSWGGGWPAV